MLDLLIHHAATPHGIQDIAIQDGVITAMGAGGSLTDPAQETMDATGLLV